MNRIPFDNNRRDVGHGLLSRANNVMINNAKTPTFSNVADRVEPKKLKVQFIVHNNPTIQTSNLNVQINPKTWPCLKDGDLIEIQSIPSGQSNDDESSPFLLKVVTASFTDTVPIDSIRIDQAASASPFSIKQHTFVHASIIDQSYVMLDLVELIFKEQYLNGYDMYRIKKQMENSCVYLKKNIEFIGMRLSVREMWATTGAIVTCGYVGEKTRLVFRSLSAMCTIYIQMSREMWEFDVNGEMYHEKAINFLGELFTNWKNQSCSHDVTIAFFSRVFYDAKSIDEFPASISADVKKDHKNRFYEDFYRVVYQNERYDDWTPTLIILKRLIKEYRDYVLYYHKRHLSQFDKDIRMPESYLSSAAEGNFLETFNLSSSVFERHFIDRPFDRTGMMSLVITPGNGLFESSRELSKITKERVIDNGIGSDLVCLGEQPLHAVPLLKYDNQEDGFDIPNWINLSFYKSSETVRYCNSSFLPSSKIKFKKKIDNVLEANAILPGYSVDKNTYLKSLEDTDNIFENVNLNKNSNDPYGNKKLIQKLSAASNMASKTKNVKNNLSNASLSASVNPDMGQNYKNKRDHNQNLDYEGYDDFEMNSSYDESDPDTTFYEESNQSLTAANYSSASRKMKTKLNPFMPSSIKQRISSQRRPWAHIFPLRSDGSPLLDHWFSVKNNGPAAGETSTGSNGTSQHVTSEADTTSTNINPSTSVGTSGFVNENHIVNSLSKISPDSNHNNNSNNPNRNSFSQLANDRNGKNLEQNLSHLQTGLTRYRRTNLENFNIGESMLTMKRGVAWKSITTPASMPLTTDYYPSRNVWEKRFVCASDYDLILDIIREQYGFTNYDYNNKISMAKVYMELIGHRMAMGFQKVVPKNTFFYSNTQQSNGSNKDAPPAPHSSTTNTNAAKSSMGPITCDLVRSTHNIPREILKGSITLSLGRTFHELFYAHDVNNGYEFVKVKIHIPKEKRYKTNKTLEYKYRFQVPDSRTYDISICEISRKNIEIIKWNYIDTYICIQGNGSLTPSELQKCWRQRLYLIPIMYVSSKSLSNEYQQQHNPHQVNTKTQQQQQQQQEEQQSSSQKESPQNNSCLSSSLNSYLLNFTNLSQSQIPASMITSREPIVRCDIFQRKSNEELKFFRDYYFVKFMEGLNKLNRSSDRRVYSRATYTYMEALNNINAATTSNAHSSSLNSANSSSNANISASNSSTMCSSLNIGDQFLAIQAIVNAMANTNKGVLTPVQTPVLKLPQQQVQLKLTSPKTLVYPLVAKYLATTTSGANSPIEKEIYDILYKEYINHMLNSQYGIPFIQNRNDIPMNCFISAEAIWWCIEQINDIDNEVDAIVFMQIMCDFNLIRHISDQRQKIYIHGFYLYYIVNENSTSQHVYTKDYCEVGFCDIDFGSSSGDRNNWASERFKLVSVRDLLPDSTNTLPVTASEMMNSYLNLIKNYTNSEFTNLTPDSILKLVNVDVDPARKSDRVEWASAVYRSHYHQLCAFELEVQWEVATGSLLNELVNGWSKLSNKFNYHIVPAPIDPFAMPLLTNSDPLRGPIYIRLNLNCLMQEENILFQSFIDEKYKLCLDELFGDKTLNQTTFKLDSSSSSSLASSACSSLTNTTMTNGPGGLTSVSAAATSIFDTNDSTLKFLNEHAPEFIKFLIKKHDQAQNVAKRIEDDPEFIKIEFLEFIEYERIIRLQYFQEAILEKFGFFRNCSIVKTFLSDDDAVFFVHSSGGMFVCIPNYYNNYSTRSRHTSSNTNITITKESVAAKSSTLILNKSSEILNNDLAKRDRMQAQVNETQYDLALVNDSQQTNNTAANNTSSNGTTTTTKNTTDSKNTSTSNSNKTSFNTSLSNSYVSSSTLNSNSISTSTGTRERSNTKSQHIFLKLNEKNYLSPNSTDIGALEYGNDRARSSNELVDSSNNNNNNNSSGNNEDVLLDQEREIKNDLLFKPKLSHQKLTSNIINEKIDQIQHQQQKEQMLLQSFVMPCTMQHSLRYLYQSEKKVPFYADSETFVGYLWSWNFMLGRRWRSQYTGDEQFQDNMLADFKLFCSNQDGRLERFFKESKDLLK